MTEALLKKVRPVKRKSGRERKAWHICIDCLQYRPTRKSYWDNKKGKRQRKEVEGNEDGKKERFPINDVQWSSWVNSWNGRFLLQCPECRYDEVVVWWWP